jgi:hypothetical protein
MRGLEPEIVNLLRLRLFVKVIMEYHAVTEKSGEWWIGWLNDLQGVNAQERTQGKILESLIICAIDMLDLKGIHDPDVEIVVPTAEKSRFAPANVESAL